MFSVVIFDEVQVITSQTCLRLPLRTKWASPPRLAFAEGDHFGTRQSCSFQDFCITSIIYPLSYSQTRNIKKGKSVGPWWSSFASQDILNEMNAFCSSRQSPAYVDMASFPSSARRCPTHAPSSSSSSESDGLFQLGLFQLGLLVQHSVWIPLFCKYLHLPDVVALLPVVAKVCTDRLCIEEATEYVSDNNKLRASLRGKAVLQLLMKVGALQTKQAYGIIGSMWEIRDNVRIMTMGQSVAARRDALLLIVLSICDEIPEGDRKNIMKTIIANMGQS